MKKKYIVIGLGNFGLALSVRLTKMGHEVIGVDSNLSKVEQHKDEITSTICLDTCDSHALKMLPLQEADAVIVAIGEDFGASVMTTALLKQHKAKRIVSRCINALHNTVLEAIGVDEILNPENHSADLFSNSLQYEGITNSYRVDDKNVILEIPVAEKYWNSTVEHASLTERFNLHLITIKRLEKGLNLFGLNSWQHSVIPNISASTVLAEDDIFVLYGSNDSFDKMFRIDL